MVCLATFALPATHAQAAPSWTLPLVNAGNVTAIAADDGVVELDVPVPAGLTTAALTGTLHGSAGALVTLRLTAGDKKASVKLDQDGLFDLKLPPLIGAVGLTLEVVASGSSQCAGAADPQAPTVSDLEVQFDGMPETPRRVGAFFPTVLDRVTIVAPSTSANGSSGATLGAAAALVRKYRAHIPVIQVTTQRPAASASPFERIIEVRPGGEAGFKLDDGVLLITGADAGLALAASRLDDPRFSLATDAWLPASIVEKRADASTLSSSFTLKQAVPRGLSVQDQRRATVSVVLEQAQFSAPFDRIDLDLRGRVQMLSNSGSVVLTTRLDGDIVRRSTPKDDGSFEVNVPGRNLLQQPRAVVTVEAQRVGAQACTPGGLTLELDAGSTGITSSSGQEPIGFAALSTAWNTRPIDITVRSDGANLDVATSLAVSMQTTNSRTLQFDAFAWEGTGVTVIGPGLTREAVDQADKDAWPLGSAAFVANTNGSRLLVVRATSSDAVRSILDSFIARGRGWADLTGDVLVADPSGTQSVAWVHEPVHRSTVTTGSGSLLSHVLRLFGIGVAVVAVAVFVLEVVRRLRRMRRAPAR